MHCQQDCHSLTNRPSEGLGGSHIKPGGQSCPETGAVRKSQSRAGSAWRPFTLTQLGSSPLPQGNAGALRKSVLGDASCSLPQHWESPAEILTEGEAGDVIMRLPF